MKKTIGLLVCIGGIASLQAQTISAEMDSLVTAYFRQSKFNGTALVAEKGRLLLEKGYGWKDAAAKTKDDGHSIYQVGSITKQFTSTIILKLQEEGKLSVNDKLTRYFPGYPHGDSITLKNLLTHTSGIYNYTDDRAFMKSGLTRPVTREELLSLFREKPLLFTPGTRWSYSNSNYVLLGYIIEKITGKPYEEVVRQWIFRPLHMDHSGFDFIHLQNPDKAQGYTALTDASYIEAPAWDSTVSFSAGAIYSTAGDLYKWMQAIEAGKILQPASWKEAFTPFKNHYGYGWIIDSLYDHVFIAHSGGISGFNAEEIRFPGNQLVIILLNNKNGPYLKTIAEGLAAIAFDQPYDIPKAPREIAVDTAILQQYAGSYQLAPDFFITVTYAHGGLKAQATGQPGFAIYPEKENKFFYKVVDAQIEFVKGADDKIDKLILYQNGRVLPAKKIK